MVGKISDEIALYMTMTGDSIIAECCLDEGRPGKLMDTLAAAALGLAAAVAVPQAQQAPAAPAPAQGGARPAAAGEPEAPEPEPSWTKDQIIEHYYEAYNNIGNVEKTWKQARQVDKSITKKDVQDWKRKNYAPLRYHRGLNSYVAKQPKEEYQIDLMFFKDLDKKTKEEEKGPYEGALLAVDIFTKYCAVEPITGTDEDAVLRGLKECIKSLGGYPKMVYHDAESAFVGAKIQKYLATHKVRSITTLGHAPVAERTIRTIKGLLYPRVETHGTKWWNELPRVLNVYNKVSKHRTIGMSPLLATEKKNEDEVRLNLELNRKDGRKYPPIREGDRVRVYKKKQLGEKENVPPWTKETWKVTYVGTKEKGRAQGVPIIQVDTSEKPLPAKKNYLMRHEVFKVPY